MDGSDLLLGLFWGLCLAVSLGIGALTSSASFRPRRRRRETPHTDPETPPEG